MMDDEKMVLRRPTRRTFLRLLLAAIAAPSVVAAATAAPRRISITIENEPGMVSVAWVEKELATPEMKKLIKTYLKGLKKHG